MGGYTRDIVGLVTLFFGFAALGLVISHASQTSQVAKTLFSGINTLGQTIQNPGGGSGLSVPTVTAPSIG